MKCQKFNTPLICAGFGLILSLISLNVQGQADPISQFKCTDNGCSGSYTGPEFIDGSDVAHQFYNTISAAVGDKLKELFDNKLYSQVDLTNISMTTEGMGTGSVVFKLNMPFVHVKDRCDAFTSFDHCGGWNQTPALASRKRQRSSALLIGEELDISELKQTDEGLQKYWI